MKYIAGIAVLGFALLAIGVAVDGPGTVSIVRGLRDGAGISQGECGQGMAQAWEALWK